MSAVIKNEISRIAGVTNTWFVANIMPSLDAAIKGCMVGVTFKWGHPLEIVADLQQMTKNDDLKFEKFPLIALFLDIPVFKNKYGDYDGTLLEIIIANSTQQKYLSTDRENQNFAPILRPIYNKFISEISKSSVFAVNDDNTDLKHEYNERFFWGKQGIYGVTGNTFNDYIDAIHIKNLDLKLNPTNCY